MRLQCDVCERAPATMICCADEAALCTKCDVEVHAANKLASKHQRLLLHALSNKLPPCDICQEKAALIFCVEDRALICQDCDKSIHSAGSLSANHQRFLATGIRVALSSSCNNENDNSHLDPPNKSGPQNSVKAPAEHQSSCTSPWAMEDLLQFSDTESSQKKGQLEVGEVEWLADMGLLGEHLAQEALEVAEVPQLPPASQSYLPTAAAALKTKKSYFPFKKPRIEVSEDDDEFFTVPDLG